MKINFKGNKGEFTMKTENLDKIISYMLYKNEKLVIFQIDKMLYLIQAYSLAKYNKPAFQEEIVCGFFGATVPAFSKNLKRDSLSSYKKVDFNSLDNNLKEIINEVVSYYSHFNKIALGGLTMTYIQFYKKDFDISEIGKIEVGINEIKQNHINLINETGYIF